MKLPQTIVFATNSAHKLLEVREIIGKDVEVLSLADIGCTDDIPENEPTLEGNALSKARWVKSRYGYDCFADDTGLEVEALSGEPGVKSARYAQEHLQGASHDSEANMRLLLQKMQGVENRRARFRTVIALVTGNDEQLFEGIVEGTVEKAPRGADGFGYDPVFMPAGCDLTFAQMTSQQKNSLSHRRRALDAMLG